MTHRVLESSRLSSRCNSSKIITDQKATTKNSPQLDSSHMVAAEEAPFGRNEIIIKLFDLI